MKIVYITGLGHSGSTILDMVLGCHPEMTGLGEIAQLIKATQSELEDKQSRYNTLLCSCGERINNCGFWKAAKQVLAENSGLSKVEKYQKIIHHFQSLYGDRMVLVDSSKIVNECLVELNRAHDLKIIFLARDFRSWCYSRNRKLGKNILILGYQWARWTWGVWHFLKRNNLSYKQLGYEELALYPDVMLKEVCDFIGVEYDPCMLSPENTKSHIVEGNTARGDSEKRQRIRYDARWMTSLPLAFYSVLLFPLMTVNRRLVYSNFLQKKVTAFGRKGDDFLLFSVKRKEAMINYTKKIK